MTDNVGAIIVAAGSATRMAGADKIFAPLAATPIIAHTLRAFEESRLVSLIVLVLAPERLDDGRAVSGRKVTAVVAGGSRRQDSVRLGLEALGECEYVLVHDGPRPFVTSDLIKRAIEAARENGAAVPAVPVTDTIKEAGEDGLVARTLDRSRLHAIQTPQAFRRDILVRAHAEVAADVTDDAAMVEALGIPVRIFEGDPRNIKITTPEDLRLAEAMLECE